MEQLPVVGIIPARMGSTRFPGKPLKYIHGMTMLEHCWRRAMLWEGWKTPVAVATPDKEIARFCSDRDIPVFRTTKSPNTRALDACAEATQNLPWDTIIVNVQGDEPMVDPANIDKLVTYMQETSAGVAVLTLPIQASDLTNRDYVKVIGVGEYEDVIVYTTRCPVPVAKTRVAGMLAFKQDNLSRFWRMRPNDHEMLESCDINRLIGHGYFPVQIRSDGDNYQSVDSREDLERVRTLMLEDEIWLQGY